jgi:hypothetical protein
MFRGTAGAAEEKALCKHIFSGAIASGVGAGRPTRVVRTLSVKVTTPLADSGVAGNPTTTGEHKADLALR